MDSSFQVSVAFLLRTDDAYHSKLTELFSSKSSFSDHKDKLDSSRGFGSRRHGDTSSAAPGKGSTFNIPPALSSGTSSSAGASSAFGLGSGAFASFGSAKTPRTPSAGASFELSNGYGKGDKEASAGDGQPPNQSQSQKENSSHKAASTTSSPTSSSSSSGHALKNNWTLFYRPPTSKHSDYEKSTIQVATLSTVEDFWTIYSHLKRPSQLPSVSDYHIFKEGIRPVWEDEANKKGGKWIVRLKKGVADRYWEDLLLAIVGDQFMEAGDEVCGAVLSVRSGEDVLNIWTKNDGGRNVKIRETVKRLLALPADTNIVWKSHDDSIAQRSALDEARQQKAAGTGQGHKNHDKRRQTISEESDKAQAR